MDLHISLDREGSLTRQIFDEVRDAILSGRLQPGDPVPSSREFASSLGVARNTVTAALDHLRAEGYLHARAGVGTFVSGEFHRADQVAQQSPSALEPLSRWRDGGIVVPELSGPAPYYDFRAGLPDPDEFPYPTWRRLVDETNRRSIRAGVYADPAGHTALRTALARHLAVSRGLRIGADDLVVTNGVQQAISLIAQVLVEPSDVVAIEDPGYLPARRALEATGARVVSVPVDDQGLDVRRLPERARLVYVTPAHQFPLGVRMPLARRTALLDWAETAGAAVVEDDYDTDFRYVGRPIDPLHVLDRSGRVIYVGSFSKTMLPTLRVGYCVAPPGLVPALRRARYVADWHGPLSTQLALAGFIEEGRLAAHLRKMRRLYHARRDLITTIIARDFSDRLTPIPSVAGLHLAAWAEGADAATVDAWLESAAQAGVELEQVRDFARLPVPPALIFGFGAIPEERIEPGLAVLRDVIDSVS